MAFGTGVLLAAAVAGIVSTPHCAAMCGPLALTACAGPGAGARYGLGRTVSYTLFGALAGGAAGRVTHLLRGEQVQRVVALILAVGIAATAVRLLRMPTGPRLVPLQVRRTTSVPPMLVGLATALLPCGALASGLLVAASAACWWGGAAAMAVFSLASAPGLVAVVASGHRVREWVARAIPPARRRLAGAALLLVAAWTASRPWIMPERTCHCAHPRAAMVHVPTVHGLQAMCTPCMSIAGAWLGSS